MEVISSKAADCTLSHAPHDLCFNMAQWTYNWKYDNYPTPW